jgi:hypothetical protein
MATLKNTTINDTGYLGLPTGTTAQRPVSPVNGYVRFNTTLGYIEWYDASGATWRPIYQPSNVSVEFLVIAGGGGAPGYNSAGGGGAGGYRSSVAGEQSGGGSSAENAKTLTPGTTYTITVGAGGTGTWGSGGEPATSGSNSIFDDVTSIGGGKGACDQSNNVSPASGGSGGGARGNSTETNTGGAGTVNQGYAGGSGGIAPWTPNYPGGGGGGAGAVGQTAPNQTTSGAGGIGVQSSITGTPTYRAGGGGGSVQPGSGGAGGLGGGGQGGTLNPSTAGISGTSNTGGGGGAGYGATGGNGGSGVVILRYSSSYTPTFSVGLTVSTTTVGSNKVSIVTAGTGTVIFG